MLCSEDYKNGRCDVYDGWNVNTKKNSLHSRLITFPFCRKEINEKTKNFSLQLIIAIFLLFIKLKHLKEVLKTIIFQFFKLKSFDF